jgi:hypothetical protein
MRFSTYIVTVPCHNVERRVILSALEELAAELVDDFPRCLLNLVFGNRVKEVPRVRQTVCAQRTQLGKFEV